MIHSEGTIIRKLRAHFQDYNYRIDNAYIFSWESDFFCISKEGYALEFEVKISRGDFKNDFKKPRHEILTSTHAGQETKKKFLPNRFYYVVPAGMLSLDEIPKHAGLITIGNESYHGTVIVKRAPFIHKRKLEVRKILCEKFYHRYLQQLRNNTLLKHDYDLLKERLKNLYDKHPELGLYYPPTQSF